MIKAGLVGLGWWGQVLANSVKDSNKITVSGGFTRTPSNASDFINESGINIYDSYASMLEDAGLDAIILATPHSLHVDQIKLAANSGKHIYVEKPIALTLEETRISIDAARNAGVEIAVGFQRRCHPSMVSALTAVKDGSLGRILHVEGHQSAPGLRIYKEGSWRQAREEQPAGGMTGMGIHLLDSMVSVLGSVDNVTVKSKKILQDNGSILDDMTSVLLEFDSGTTGYIGTSIATSGYFSLRFFGENGVVEVRRPDLGEFVYTDQTGQIKVTENKGFNMEGRSLELFADQVNGEGKFLVSDQEVLKSSKALEMVINAAD
ncbi:MAG: Gfo/Idh/MocA family oxidoreductase [Rhodospirillales bacterium]|nr:Gfo/Idh/MocA family oxidoreductase [Rhodospirillales bacterium]MDC0989455.1 Gfo/Idh/MocA family oxidoreductase [Rhodospirillales bacterium]